MPPRKKATKKAAKSQPQKSQTPSTTDSINTDVRVELKTTLHLGDKKIELNVATDLPYGLDPGMSAELEGNVHSIIHNQVFSPFRMHIRKEIARLSPVERPDIMGDDYSAEEDDIPQDPTAALHE